MCTVVIRLKSGLRIRRFIECSTNADTLFFEAMNEAVLERGRMMGIEPCFYAIESAVKLLEASPKSRYGAERGSEPSTAGPAALG